MKLGVGDALELCHFVVILNFQKVASQKALKYGGNFGCYFASFVCCMGLLKLKTVV
jgi:hypothetical protein